MKLLLIAGHHRARIFPPHMRDTGALPSNYNGDEFYPPIYNEHHEAEKLCEQVHNNLLSVYKIESLLCPFEFNLAQKIIWANKKWEKNDILIEIHYNAGVASAMGTEVFFYDGDENSEKKANDICKMLCSILKTKNRGAKPDTSTRHGRLAIIRDTIPWSFLIEIGFISNKQDMEKVRTNGVFALSESISKNFNFIKK